MTQVTLIGFLFSFVGGPAICALLLRLPPRIWSLVVLAAGVVGTVTLALRMRLQGGDAALGSLIALWLAWVLAVAMVALALKGRMSSPRARRWLLIIALLATTLPWFGLATAEMMG